MRVLSTVVAAGIAPFLIAAQAESSAAPQQVGKVSAIDKVVCKKFPPPTGTRMRARQICKMQAEWDLIRQEEQDALDRVQGRNATRGN